VLYDPWPLAGACMSVVTSVAFACVGRVVERRTVENAGRVANALFATWWYCLAGLGFTSAGFAIAAAFGAADLALHIVLLNAALVVLCVALWALVYYFAYIFSGSTRSLVPLALFYAALYLLFTYLIAAAQPVGVEVARWGSKIVYAHDLSASPLVRPLGLALLGPPAIGAVAYFSLYFKVDDPVQRYRIGVIGGSIAVWFGSSIAASIAGVNDEAWWRPVSSGISGVAAVFVLMAYRPPAWIRARLADAAPG